MELDVDKIKAREQEFIHFEGFLPMDFLNVIDAIKRNDYLKSIGKFEEIQELNLDFRKNFKVYGLKYKDKVLAKWLADNPSFKDCVLEV